MISAAMEDGDYSGLVDPRLGEGYAPQEMARVVACAGACIRHSPRRRPKMGQVGNLCHDNNFFSLLFFDRRKAAAIRATALQNVRAFSIQLRIYQTD